MILTGWDAAAAPRRAKLRRMKTIATGLLAVMGVVFVLSARFAARVPGLAWLEAFSEAALVGGLADWFAVVALFRHPGGLPLPHTAIVPRNKDRIGSQMGRFVEDNFLTPSAIAQRLRALDLAGHLLRWLAEPANGRALAAGVRGLTPRLLEAAADDELGAVVRRVAEAELERADLARAAAELLAVVGAGDLHQRLLDRALPLVAGWLDGQRRTIKARFAKRSLLTPGWLDSYIVNGFVDGAIDLIGEVARNPDHELRAELDGYLRAAAERLRTDPELEAKAERLKAALLHSRTADGLAGLGWKALRGRFGGPPDEAASGAARTGEIVSHLARGLLAEPALVARLSDRLADGAEQLLGRFRQQFAGLIEDVVQRWDGATIADKVEVELGPDLQFVRLNGSLVGGSAGVVLHALLVVAGTAR